MRIAQQVGSLMTFRGTLSSEMFTFHTQQGPTSKYSEVSPLPYRVAQLSHWLARVGVANQRLSV
uniref:Uncharacterized protein n=1 Tax=Arundo donax TaxID=35708 RepID=A0A0A9G261_ARUDO